MADFPKERDRGLYIFPDNQFFSIERTWFLIVMIYGA